MENQENPDGIEGHNERLMMQEESRKFPKKLKFIGGKNDHNYTVPTISKSQNRLLDIEYMKKNCDSYRSGCQIKNCNSGCKRKIPLSELQKISEIETKKRCYKMLRKIMKRVEYWESNIAFTCPLKGDIHTIDECFKFCEMWGRTYQFTEEGRTVAILNCLADPHGERELHSGKVTRDN